ncbi:hypothetical protein Tco_0557773, partial [Tanacetum coccineum]
LIKSTYVAAKTGSCCSLLLREVAASFDSAVHRVHAVSFDAAVASNLLKTTKCRFCC